MTEFHELLIVDREERALERRKHRQLIVGPFDGRERRANRLDFLAAVKRLAADEQVGNTTRLDRVDVLAGDVLAEAHEAPEQDRDMARLKRHSGLGAVGLRLADL